MKIVSAAAMRELDRRTIEEHGTPGATLMERAAQGVAGEVLNAIRAAGLTSPSILLVAGKGNNGGDAAAAARILHERGIDTEVWLAGTSGEMKGDAATHLQRMLDGGVPLREMADAGDWVRAMGEPVRADLIVDGLLGTGFKGPPRSVAAAAIEWMGRASERSLVVSIDLPSGLDPDEGPVAGPAVQADITVTMGLPKKGLMEPSALDYVGNLKVVEIGIPSAYVEAAKGLEDVEFLDATDVRPLLRRRPRSSHKGTFGHVLLVGGAKGYTGAMTLAAKAALRSGAGRVDVYVPGKLVPVLASAVPAAMVHGGVETPEGSLSLDSWADLRGSLRSYQAVLIGPGLTRSNDSLMLVKQFLRECTSPLVLDADALSVLRGQPDTISHANAPVVITPHPGEFAMLFDQEIEDVQADRLGMAVAGAKLTQSVVVLKGAGTVLAAPDRTSFLNLTGNPGMATGGSGDVLAGMLCAFFGQGMDAWSAAQAAVYLHGRAGDLAALQLTQSCTEPADLLDHLPAAFREVSPR